MDRAPNFRPGALPALTAAVVLLAVLAALFFPGFSADQSLSTNDEFPRGIPVWDSTAGLGEPTPVLSPGSQSAILALCKLSADPSRVFANIYPPLCLFLLGMAAWFCLRQWDCPTVACLLGALAAGLNGVFLTSAVGPAPWLAMGGAWAFVALGLVRLRPRLEWPQALLAGFALVMACIEAGAAGLYLSIGVTALAIGLPAADESQQTGPRMKTALLIPLTLAVFIVGGIYLDAFREIPIPVDDARPFALYELPGIAVAGLTGHRVDVPDSSGQWGSIKILGLHFGVPVLVLAAWALAHALRRESMLVAADRKRVFALAGLAAVAGLLGLLSPLCLAPGILGAVLLTGYGVRAVDDWYTSEAHEKTRALGSGGFDTAWRIGSIGVLTLAAISFVVYNGQSGALAKWLQTQYPVLSLEFTRGLAAASIWQAGLFVLFLALTVAAFLVFGLLKWTPRVRGACLGILGVLLAADLVRSGLPFRHYDLRATTASDHPAVQYIRSEPVLGRLALLDDFQLPDGGAQSESLPLDRWLIGKYLATPENALPKIEDAKVEQVVHAFHGAIGRYNDPDRLDALQNQIAKMMASEQGAPIEREMGELMQMPAGPEFLACEGDQAIIRFFRHIIRQRLGQLNHARALLHASQLREVYHGRWARNEFARLPVVRAPGYPPPSAGAGNRGRLLRWWELNSVRYFLCVSGNDTIGRSVRNEFPYLALPIYRNLPNHLLDPSQRRFLRREDYSLNPATARLTPATNGPVALVEFTGALPRLQLFADWQSGLDDDKTSEILYQHGFNPHQQVLLSETIDPPAHPSQTSGLPRPEIVAMANDRVELKIPVTHFPTVLLFNDAHHPGWTVMRDGQPAPLLRANRHMRAVYLPAAAQGQSVVFQFQPERASVLPFWLLLGLALLITACAWRSRWVR